MAGAFARSSARPRASRAAAPPMVVAVLMVSIHWVWILFGIDGWLFALGVAAWLDYRRDSRGR